jgi:dTDP-4-dehydrorhamnose 3,5-epimerase-like enzyme
MRECGTRKLSLHLGGGACMFDETNPIIAKIGNVDDVHVWSMPTYPDARGRLFKAYSSANIELLPIPFVTYEHFFTESQLNVFRGMHFQGKPHPVSKIISIVQGSAIDFLFDMRENSATFRNLQIIDLDATNPSSIFIPPGVAHGYLATTEKTIISYRMNGPFCANCDGGFSGELIADYLPISFEKTIQSVRDAVLLHFDEYKYVSKCEN